MGSPAIGYAQVVGRRSLSQTLALLWGYAPSPRPWMLLLRFLVVLRAMGAARTAGGTALRKQWGLERCGEGVMSKQRMLWTKQGWCLGVFQYASSPSPRMPPSINQGGGCWSAWDSRSLAGTGSAGPRLCPGTRPGSFTMSNRRPSGAGYSTRFKLSGWQRGNPHDL